MGLVRHTIHVLQQYGGRCDKLFLTVLRECICGSIPRMCCQNKPRMHMCGPKSTLLANA